MRDELQPIPDLNSETQEEVVSLGYLQQQSQELLYVSLLPMRGAGGISHQKETKTMAARKTTPLRVLLDTLAIVNTITTSV